MERAIFAGIEGSPEPPTSEKMRLSHNCSQELLLDSLDKVSTACKKICAKGSDESHFEFRALETMR